MGDKIVIADRPGPSECHWLPTGRTIRHLAHLPGLWRQRTANWNVRHAYRTGQSANSNPLTPIATLFNKTQRYALAATATLSALRAMRKSGTSRMEPRNGGAVMNHTGPDALIGLVLIAPVLISLVLISLRRQLLFLILSMLIFVVRLGLYQIAYFLHH